MRKTDSKKLETRDFISVGIFSLIYAVVAFVIGGVAQMTPVTFPFMPMIVALFTGTVFMLYVAKIPKKGAQMCIRDRAFTRCRYTKRKAGSVSRRGNEGEADR